MTVTPTNVGQVADVVRGCHDHGYGMFSFQPAAFVGDDRRWHESYRDTTADQVWAEIERAAPSTDLVTTMQHQHQRVDEYAEQAEPLAHAWFRDPSAIRSEQLASPSRRSISRWTHTSRSG